MPAHSIARNDMETLNQSSEEERLRDQVKKLFRHLDSAEQEFQEKEDALKQAVGLLTALSRPGVKPEVQELLDHLGREVRKGNQPELVKTFVADIKEKVTLESEPATVTAPKESGSPSEPKGPSPSQKQPLVAEPRSQRLSEPPSGPPPSVLKERGQSEAREDVALRRPQNSPSSPLTKEGDTGLRTAPQAAVNRVETVASKEPSRQPVSLVSSQRQSPTGLPEREVEEKIRTILGAILEHIHIEDQPGLREGVSALKSALAAGELFQRLPQIQQQLIDVLTHYRKLHDTERKRLEELLKELIGKLAEIEKNVLNGLSEHHKEAMADNAQFAERLEGQVLGMEEIAQLKDLNVVRTALVTRTERMRAAIQVKRDADAALSAAFTDKVHALERQLRDANHQLSSMTDRAYHDPLLAGVYNRLAFNEKLGQEIARFERYQHAVSLIIFDMDRFKLVNDTYGHQAGDWALQTLATRVKPALRAPDFFARFGGDEFALVLPNTPLTGAVVVAERLRTLMHSTTFCYETQELQVSLSVGVATVRTGDTTETVLERADQALYLAKEQGRNRVCSETDLPPPPPSTIDKMVGFFSRKLPFRK
jgi:diguanylate cyclase (GGDEF)-like protein